MLVYQDLLMGDELLSDSFIYREIENGMLWEVEGESVPIGVINIDKAISANPKGKGDFKYHGVKADEGEIEEGEGEGEGEGVDDKAAVKVIDIVDAFRLRKLEPGLTQKGLVIYMNKFINALIPKLDEEKQEKFKKYIEGATKYLLGMFSRLNFYCVQSNHGDGSLVFSYQKKGAPTFLYFAYGLKEIKY